MTTAPPAPHRPRRGPVRRVLTAVEFDVLWEWLGLGATPVVLRLDSPGRTHTERRGIVATGWQGLRERGLADVSGPDPEIVRLMHLLAVPTCQVELRMRMGRELRAVAAARPGATVLAVRQDETVTLSAAPGPIGAITEAMPPAPSGPGRAVSVPSADLDAAAAESEAGLGLAEALRYRGVPAEEAELVAAMMSGERRRGQISVLAADHWGVLHRLPKIIGMFETHRGRYLIQRDTAADGVDWTTLAPTTQPSLRRRLERLLTQAESHATRF